MENLKQKTYKAFAWDFIGKISGQTVSFIISIILARLLAPEHFGMLAMVNVIIGISGSLMDMGLGVALIQRKNTDESHYGSVFFFNITVGLLLATLLFFSAPLVGSFYQNPQLIPIARTMALLFVLNSIGNVIRLKLKKELNYAKPVQANITAAALSGGIGVILAFKGFEVWSLVAQSLLNSLFANTYLFIIVKWRPKLIFKWKALKELWSFGFKMFLAGILDSVFSNAATIIIGKLFSPATLGYYFRASSLNGYVVQYSSSSLMSVLFPALSRVQDDLARFKEIVFKGFHLINFLAFLLTGLFFVIGADVILFLFGAKWEQSIPMFQLIILTAYGYPLSSLLVNVLSASGNSTAFFKLEVIKKILFGSSLAIGFIWGIKGYLICNAIAYALAVYANMLFAGKQLKTGSMWFLKITLSYLFLAGILAAGLFIAHQYISFNHAVNLIVFGSLFIILYFILSKLFKLNGSVLFWDEIQKFSAFQNIKKAIRFKKP